MVSSILKRRYVRRVVVATLCIVCAMITGGTLYIDYLMSAFGGCKAVVRSSIISPDGNKSIVIFGKECGATVGFNTQASIAPVRGPFSPEKNPAFFAISDRPDVMAKWIGDNAVEVVIPKGVGVFRSEQSVGEVRIEYRS